MKLTVKIDIDPESDGPQTLYFMSLFATVESVRSDGHPGNNFGKFVLREPKTNAVRRSAVWNDVCRWFGSHETLILGPSTDKNARDEGIWELSGGDKFLHIDSVEFFLTK